MKKYMVLTLLMISCLCGCGRKDNAAQDNWVSPLAEGTPAAGVDLSADDASTLLDITESAQWIEESPDCLQDSVIVLAGEEIYYHSSCGTFEKRGEPAQSLKLDEKTKHLVNTMLEKYIELEK